MKIPRIGVLLGIGLLTLPGCADKTPAAGGPPVPEAPEVTVARPERREIVDYVEFPGRVAAVGQVEIRARVSGYIVKVHFTDGQDVRNGDLLFEIDPRPYQHALNQAQGELARLKALSEKAKIDVSRAEQLRPSGAISQDEYEGYLANLKVHEGSIQAAQAAVAEAELNLEFTRVVSPIDGRVNRREVTEGNLVQAGSGDSTVLTTVVTTDPVYVYFNIEEPTLLEFERLGWRTGDETLLSRIRELNISVEIGLADEKGFPHVGQLDFVGNAVDPETGTISARGRFENARYLTPGMFVRVRVPIGPAHEALLVSERAFGTDQGQKYVLTVDSNRVVQYRPVKLGSLRDGCRVVESGLEPDDLVIVRGLQRVRPGDKASPHTAEEEEKGAPPSGSGGAKDGKADDPGK